MANFTGFLNKKKRSADEEYMKLALEAAEIAKSRGDAARGAVLVLPNNHIVEGQSVFSDHDPLAYAEMNVLRKAKNKSLYDAVLYSTTEPCAFCVCAAYEYGIREFVFGAFDDVNGFVSSGRGIITENFNLVFFGGILSESCYNITSPSLRENLRYIPKEK